MKKRWYHFKLLCKEITNHNPWMWGWLIASIAVTVLLPLAQLFLSAQVISWLLNGLSISAYLSQLAIWISVIVVLNIIQQLLNRYISLEHEFFRIGLMYKITNVLNRQDYPLIFWKKVKRVFPNR